MATIEEISSEIVRVGCERRFHVVPEFSMSIDDVNYIKKVDIAWLVPLTRISQTRHGSLAQWKVIAVFEIEGCNVAYGRIRLHAEQLNEIQSGVKEHFKKYVVLYNKALHRKEKNWEVVDPSKMVEKRAAFATEKLSALSVRDGRNMNWLSSESK